MLFKKSCLPVEDSDLNLPLLYSPTNQVEMTINIYKEMDLSLASRDFEKFPKDGRWNIITI